MKRQSRRRLTRRRKQKGGAIDCKVIVFSKEKLTKKTADDFKELLEKLSKGKVSLEEGGMYKFMFVGETGLPSKYHEESEETVFVIETPPDYLIVKNKTNAKLDSALTKLEYEIRDNMGSIPLKLIPPSHGLYNPDGQLFYVGIMPT
jgi:hypothetical protein